LDSSILVAGTGVSRRFGSKVALDGVDIAVRQGDRLALFGANGAGKTTLLRILAGSLKPTSGTLSVDPSRIGLVTHRTLLYDDLSALENLVFFAKLHGVGEPEERALRQLDAVGLGDRADEPVRGFSRGMQQRVAFARALIQDPSLLLLDEPATGLDARSSARLRAFLLESVGSATWIIASHDVDEGLALSRRWMLLDEGRVVAEGNSEGVDADRARALVADAA
jgi:heme exporter protein A